MDLVLLRDFLNRLNSLQRFERYTGFEFGIVSSAFAFHSVLFGLVYNQPRNTTIIA